MNRFKSVWDAISYTKEESASMKARSEIMMAVAGAVEGWNVPQRVAAQLLGITQPRVNDLLQGRIGRFSLDALFDLAARARLEPGVTMTRPRGRGVNAVRRKLDAQGVRETEVGYAVRGARRRK